nr:hypothetical protein [uncultured Pedobacter sp.]
MKIKKSIRVTVLIFVMIYFSKPSIAQQSTFSGSWGLNKEKSDLGGLGVDIAAPKVIEVLVKGDSITVKRTFADKQPFIEALISGGKEVETLPDGNLLKRAKVQYVKDKPEIIFNWYYEVSGNQWNYKRVENWSISEEGKLLTIERITTLPDKIDKVLAVYLKATK